MRILQKYDEYKGWMRPKKEVSSLDEILKLWDKINYTTTERIYDSINVSKSDTIYNSENIYRSQDCSSCKNTVFSDGCANSEYIIACLFYHPSPSHHCPLPKSSFHGYLCSLVSIQQSRAVFQHAPRPS